MSAQTRRPRRPALWLALMAAFGLIGWGELKSYASTLGQVNHDLTCPEHGVTAP